MKRILNISIIALFAAGLLVSCEENKDMFTINVPPTVDVVSGADIAFKAIGGEGYIEVAPVDGQLQVSTDQSSWCHLSVEGTKIHVKVDGYSGLESRYAKVVMTAGEATGVTVVHQFGIIVREFAPKDVTVNNDAQDVTVSYEANESLVEAESDADWARILVEKDLLRIRLEENQSREYREAHIHWHFGEMKGDFTVAQFDLAQAGLLGDWTFYALNATTGKPFSYYPLEADLSAAEDGTYTLAVTKESGNVVVDYKITGVVMEKNCLMLPLGGHIGTHKPNANNLYQVFPLFAPSTTAVQYDNAVTTGYFPFVITKDAETGEWRATGDTSPFEEMTFRFEFWKEKTHPGTSNSRTALKEIYMVKN